MFTFKKSNSRIKRIVSLIISFTFFFNIVLSDMGLAQALNLPAPGTMLTLTPAFAPPMIKGLEINPLDPFQFDFFVNSGEDNLEPEVLKIEAERMIRYFFASLTIPEDDLWVNLSPYEQDRIIEQTLSQTDLGRDLLAEDYLLKQIMASVLYPEDELGQAFWRNVYHKAYEKYGTTEIPIDTFHKVWILPDKAVVYETGNRAFVAEASLKVMLEEDYIAVQENRREKIEDTKSNSSTANKSLDPSDIDYSASSTLTSNISTSILRDIVIPEITREVNEGKHFAQLRQIYNSLILANWYKDALRESILGKLYVNQKKVDGITLSQSEQGYVQTIYDQYLEAFKTGVYNYIKVEYDANSQRNIPRKYFSGGANLAMVSTPKRIIELTAEQAENIMGGGDKMFNYAVGTLVDQGQDSAMAQPLLISEPLQPYDVFNKLRAMGITRVIGIFTDFGGQEITKRFDLLPGDEIASENFPDNNGTWRLIFHFKDDRYIKVSQKRLHKIGESRSYELAFDDFRTGITDQVKEQLGLPDSAMIANRVLVTQHIIDALQEAVSLNGDSYQTLDQAHAPLPNTIRLVLARAEDFLVFDVNDQILNLLPKKLKKQIDSLVLDNVVNVGVELIKQENAKTTSGHLESTILSHAFFPENAEPGNIDRIVFYQGNQQVAVATKNLGNIWSIAIILGTSFKASTKQEVINQVQGRYPDQGEPRISIFPYNPGNDDAIEFITFDYPKGRKVVAHRQKLNSHDWEVKNLLWVPFREFKRTIDPEKFAERFFEELLKEIESRQQKFENRDKISPFLYNSFGSLKDSFFRIRFEQPIEGSLGNLALQLTGDDNTIMLFAWSAGEEDFQVDRLTFYAKEALMKMEEVDFSITGAKVTYKVHFPDELDVVGLAGFIQEEAKGRVDILNSEKNQPVLSLSFDGFSYTIELTRDGQNFTINTILQADEKSPTYDERDVISAVLKAFSEIKKSIQEDLSPPSAGSEYAMTTEPHILELRTGLTRNQVVHQIKSMNPEHEDFAMVNPVHGGIDFARNQFDLDIKRDENGMVLPFELQDLEGVSIQSLTPVIINFTIVTNLPMLLGYNISEDSFDSGSAEFLADEIKQLSYLN